MQILRMAVCYIFYLFKLTLKIRLGTLINVMVIALGEQQFGGTKDLPECPKQKYSQMYSVFFKKKRSLLKFFSFFFS